MWQLLEYYVHLDDFCSETLGWNHGKMAHQRPLKHNPASSPTYMNGFQYTFTSDQKQQNIHWTNYLKQIENSASKNFVAIFWTFEKNHIFLKI